MNSKFLKVVRNVLIVIVILYLLYISIEIFDSSYFGLMTFLFIIPVLVVLSLIVILFMAIEQILRNTEKMTEYIYKKEYEESKKDGKLDLSKIDTSEKLDVWYCDCGITNQGNRNTCKGCGKQKN